MLYLHDLQSIQYHSKLEKKEKRKKEMLIIIEKLIEKDD